MNMVFLLRRLVGVVVEGFCTGVDMGVGMDVGNPGHGRGPGGSGALLYADERKIRKHRAQIGL